MGRHKQFERKEVTDKALRKFCQKGYLDTSLKDLEEATGIFKPALYSEFGSKAGLFLECINYYRENYAKERLLKREPFGWNNIEDFLKPDKAPVCESTCFEVDAFARDIPILKRELQTCIDKGIDHIPAMIRKNLEAEGVVAKKLDMLTSTIFTFYCGLSILSKSLSPDQLEKQTMDFLDYVRD